MDYTDYKSSNQKSPKIRCFTSLIKTMHTQRLPALKETKAYISTSWYKKEVGGRNPVQ